MSFGTIRIQQLYGYLVCLIAIVTLLISVASFTNAILDLTRPNNVGLYGPDSEASSYAAYRLNQLERTTTVQEKTGRSDLMPTDSAMRADFETQRQTREAYDRWSNKKSIITSALMIIVAFALFMIHWRWLRSLTRQPEAA